MPALIAPENCLALQQLASEPSDLPMVMRSPLGIGVSSHPVAMWVIKSYLRSDYKLAHSPGFAILKPGLGIDGTGGWHSDYPYHPGTGRLGGYQESYGKFPSEIPFGLQFNTCITDFTPENVQKAAPFGSSSEASETALLRRGGPASSWARAT